MDLLPAERLLWTGSPVRFPVFDATDLVAVPFSIMWCGFAVFWEVTVIRTNGPSFLVLWGLMFVLVGLYFVAGRLIVRWLTLRGTEYAVTDQRVVVHSSVLGIDRERSEYLTNLEPPTLRESANGAGTIRFGSSSGYPPMFHARWPAQKSGIQLREIENARFVRDTIAKARAGSRDSFHS